MSDTPTPETNLNRIIKMEGRMDVQAERYVGFMKAHEQTMQEVVRARKDLDKNVGELHDKSNGALNLATANASSLKSHIDLSNERNNIVVKTLAAIDDKITTNQRWTFSNIITAIGLVVGWLIAILLAVMNFA